MLLGARAFKSEHSTTMEHKPTVSTSVLKTVLYFLLIEAVIVTAIWTSDIWIPVLKTSALRVLTCNH